ncbi:hypothetical protein NPIL_526533 [Nephila pilipes]|nr:hypothetical protein NPIL_526533 [Nephila pilipes]
MQASILATNVVLEPRIIVVENEEWIEELSHRQNRKIRNQENNSRNSDFVAVRGSDRLLEKHIKLMFQEEDSPNLNQVEHINCQRKRSNKKKTKKPAVPKRRVISENRNPFPTPVTLPINELCAQRQLERIHGNYKTKDKRYILVKW